MPNKPVRERIMNTAFDLFYRQGYRATGINQVIGESGVAKASFYDHFPSKDDLLYEYLEAAARKDIEDLQKAAAEARTADERFFAPLLLLKPWFEESGYRGCPFQNIVAEAPPSDPRVREIVRRHNENLRAFLRKLAEELLQRRPNINKINAEDLANTYLLLFQGTIATAVAYRHPMPVDAAIKALELYLSSV